MARIRTIKPDFWRDESLSKVSPEACLLAIGLLNHCDDEGYFNANHKLVEADVFPLRDLSSTTTELLRELSEIGYINVFDGEDGKVYGHVATFEKHQVINKKTPSKIKHLCKLPHDYGSDTVDLPSGKEGKGNGMEGIVTHDLATARSSPAAPISEIVGMYNTILPMLPQVTVVSESRKRLVAARWREVVTTDKLDREKGLEFFEWFFKHVRGSRFLTGQAKDWKANFEFLFTASKFPRIIEGAYHEDKK